MPLWFLLLLLWLTKCACEFRQSIRAILGVGDALPIVSLILNRKANLSAPSVFRRTLVLDMSSLLVTRSARLEIAHAPALASWPSSSR